MKTHLSPRLDRQLCQGLLGICGEAVAVFNDFDPDGFYPVLIGQTLDGGRRVHMTLHDFLVANPNYQRF